MPAILNESGEELEGPSEGYLVGSAAIRISVKLGTRRKGVMSDLSLQTGVQAAVARRDEDGVRQSRQV